MSRDARFDQLEAEIVAALRRAPGDEPSAELDARIRARAHAAVAATTRRTQPRWLAAAAGLVVLVGSGLALRIMQQVERPPGPLDAPMQSVPAPTASGPQERAGTATEADQTAGAMPADSELVRPPEPDSQVIPEATTVAPIQADPEPAADKLRSSVGELAAPAAKAASSAPASPKPEPDSAEQSRMRREPAKPFPATSDARSEVAPATPIEVAPIAAPPAPAPPPPPPASMDDGYARESIAADTAAPADAPAPPLQEEAKARSEPFEIRDRDAQPGADSNSARRADAEVRANAAQLDERAAAGALARPPRATTGVQAAPGLTSEDAVPPQEFESVDAATAARRAADYELRVDAIGAALKRGERNHARELAAALERDFPEATLPRTLRRQLAR